MGQLLAHALTPPLRRGDKDVYAFMVTDFIDAVRQCLKSGGFAKKDNETETGGIFLVGYAGRLFMIDDDYQVGEHIDGLASCGCGADIALGVLSVTEDDKPEDRIIRALETAERFSAGVRGPFHIESM